MQPRSKLNEMKDIEEEKDGVIWFFHDLGDID